MSFNDGRNDELNGPIFLTFSQNLFTGVIAVIPLPGNREAYKNNGIGILIFNSPLTYSRIITLVPDSLLGQCFGRPVKYAFT